MDRPSREEGRPLLAWEREVVLRAISASRLDPIAQGLLRRQCDECRVVRVDVSGHGYFATLRCASPAADVSALSGVNADAAELRHGVGFVVWLSNGRIDGLEAFAYGEPWPPSLTLRRWL
ncbi:MAG: hypothetical protein AAGE52_18380 [Myxococcota bacterium]